MATDARAGTLGRICGVKAMEAIDEVKNFTTTEGLPHRLKGPVSGLPHEVFVDNFLRLHWALENEFVHGGTWRFDPIDEQALDELQTMALAQLAKFDFVGITESMATSLQVFCKVFGTCVPTAWASTHRETNRAKVNPHVAAFRRNVKGHLRRTHRRDVAVYEAAQRTLTLAAMYFGLE